MNQETHFYFLSKTYTHLSTKFLFIIFTYEYTARKSDLQIFVYLVKYLVIFIVLISEKFKASFYLVVTFVELPWLDCSVHHIKKTVKLKQNYHHTLVAQ